MRKYAPLGEKYDQRRTLVRHITNIIPSNAGITSNYAPFEQSQTIFVVIQLVVVRGNNIANCRKTIIHIVLKLINPIG